MTKRKKKPPATLNMSFDEALVRFVQTDPKELADLHDKVQREGEETERYVNDRERSIRRGARRATKRFRL